MQQSQTILSGCCGAKIVSIDIKIEGNHDRCLRDAVSQTSKPAYLAIIGGESEASISSKLQDHPNHVLFRQKSSQLAGKASVSVGVISRFFFLLRHMSLLL